MRILIAEDDAGIGRAVQVLLERSRYAADWGQDGTRGAGVGVVRRI